MQIKISIFILSIIFNTLCKAQIDSFPKLRQGNYTFKINERFLKDEYILLDSLNKETENWLYAEKLYLKKYKSKLKHQTTYENIKSLNYYVNSSYTILGKYFFKIFYNDNGQGIYKSNHISEADLLIDSRDISENKDKVPLFRSMSVSGDMNYLAYTYSINGSEHLNLKIFNLSNKKYLKENLSELDWKDIQWFKNGFFYSKFDSTSVYYHQLNTDPIKDTIVVANNKNKSISQEYFVLNNEKYFLLKVINLATKQTSAYVANLSEGNFQYIPLIIKNDEKIDFIEAYDSLIYYTASAGEYKNNLYYINPRKPKTWHLVLPQQENELLSTVKIINHHIIAAYKKGPKEILRVYEMEGGLISAIEMPIGFSISNIQGVKDANSFYFDLISFCLPALTYEYNFKKNTYSSIEGVYINFESDKYEMISSEAIAYDGVKIPILIAKSKATNLENAPTLLECYGGYGINFENNFRADLLEFMNKGGVYVRAYIRGGGELGEAWHKAGSGIYKSNTYNDLIYCAKYLIQSKYTTANKLAVRGGSHGGLVVGVAITQNPELFKAAICEAAPLNIVGLLNQKKSIYQNNEYGNPNDTLELDKLIQYNPYYNIQPKVNYPSMLIYASDHDERVPWSNSAKFVAKLQNRPVQTNPIVFLLEENAGHFGAEKSYESLIKNHAFQNRFLYRELGMD